MTTRQLLDPTSEWMPADKQLVTRPATLQGLTVGLLDISKARGDIFLARLEEILTMRGVRVERFHKPTFTKVLPDVTALEMAERVDVVIEALAD